MWIVHREKKKMSGFRCLFTARHFSVISLAPSTPHRAFRSQGKLALLPSAPETRAGDDLSHLFAKAQRLKEKKRIKKKKERNLCLLSFPPSSSGLLPSKELRGRALVYSTSYGAVCSSWVGISHANRSCDGMVAVPRWQQRLHCSFLCIAVIF